MTETTATRSPRQRQTRRKPARFCRISREKGGDFLVLKTVRPCSPEVFDLYKIEPVVCDYGRGLILHKPDGTSYYVNLSGTDSTCDCKGHTSHGHCKHVSALLALQQHGKL